MVPVHAVHHPPVMAEDDQIGQVRRQHEPGMFHDVADGGRHSAAFEPVRGVHLGDRLHRDRVHRQTQAQLNEPVDIHASNPASAGQKWYCFLTCSMLSCCR